jgi:ABC-type lipoprotein release transport system permease subunit
MVAHRAQVALGVMVLLVVMVVMAALAEAEMLLVLEQVTVPLQIVMLKATRPLLLPTVAQVEPVA